LNFSPYSPLVAEEFGRRHPWLPHTPVHVPPWMSICSRRLDGDIGLTSFEDDCMRSFVVILVLHFQASAIWPKQILILLQLRTLALGRNKIRANILRNLGKAQQQLVILGLI
jgi:hypothetical protein